MEQILLILALLLLLTSCILGIIYTHKVYKINKKLDGFLKELFINIIDEIIKEASKSDINVGWSNPCFEIWMFAYFGNMPVINESWACCGKFGELYKKRTGHEYSKSDPDMYRRLIENGDETTAIKLAQRKYDQCISNGYNIPSKMCPCTTVHELVNEIQKKVKTDNYI